MNFSPFFDNLLRIYFKFCNFLLLFSILFLLTLKKHVHKTFLKTKKSLELASLTHFLHNYGENYFLRYILLTDQISFPDFLYFLRCWAISVLLHQNDQNDKNDQKVRTKNLNILRTKPAFLNEISIFYYIQRAFHCQKLSQSKEEAFKDVFY